MSRPVTATVQSLSVVARALDVSIRAYQAVRAGRPSPCRFTPSCSTYAREALAQHGAGRGSALAIRRLSRCHPWGGAGFDPVPHPSGFDTRSPDRGIHV